MTQVYLTSSLHHDWNLRFNPKLCAALESRGVSCFLPQRDTKQQERETVFEHDIAGMKQAKVILAVAQNETVNWGAEIGYAFGVGKKILILKSKDHEVALFPKHLVDQILEVDDLEDIDSYMERLESAIKGFRQ